METIAIIYGDNNRINELCLPKLKKMDSNAEKLLMPQTSAQSACKPLNSWLDFTKLLQQHGRSGH